MGLEPQGEWVEIYNAGGASITLAGYKLGDEEERMGNEGMYGFPQEVYIGPGEVLVIAYQGDSFYSVYGFYPDYELSPGLTQVPELIKYSAWSGGQVRLSNSGDEIMLLDPGDNMIDALSWGDATTFMNPAVHAAPEGYSLERYPAFLDTDSALDWRPMQRPNPGQVSLQPLTPTPTLTSLVTLTPTSSPAPLLSPTPTLSPASTPTPTPTHSPTPTTTHTPTPTLEFHLVVNEILADPAQDSNGDGEFNDREDEFVEIVNPPGGSTVDLSGWSLSDVVEIRHIFPAGTLLLPGCGIVVFGGGTPVGEFGHCLVQTASTGMLALFDGGDIVYVKDINSVVVASLAFVQSQDLDQSLTRFPDITGPEPLIKHSDAPGSGGALFSPGTLVDGTIFSGCVE